MNHGEQGLPGVCVYIDVVSGKTLEDHLQNCEAVLVQLVEAGLRL